VGEATEELTTEELRRDIDDRRASMSGTLEAIGDRVSPGRVIERRKNRMVVWFAAVRDRVMGTAHDVSDRLGETARAVGSAPSNAVDGVRSNTSGAPLVAGGIAFGVGMLIGSLAPPSRTERQLGPGAMEAAEPVKKELQEAGREMVAHLKEPVSQAVEDVKQTAQDGAQHVRQRAGAAGEERREAPAGNRWGPPT
jgi:ElaB/YqjD/DUF883 family membrane-anchored ribosome-binding protein